MSFCGASDLTRTGDLLITSEMHYRLCYTSKRAYYIDSGADCQPLFRNTPPRCRGGVYLSFHNIFQESQGVFDILNTLRDAENYLTLREKVGIHQGAGGGNPDAHSDRVG